jgi:alpha-glucosidase
MTTECLPRFAQIAVLLVATVLGCNAHTCAQSGEAAIKSPDGRVVITFRTVAEGNAADAGGRLLYAVALEGKPLIDESAMSLDLADQAPLGANVRMVNVAHSNTDETYRLVSGKASSVRNHYNAARIDLVESGGAGRKLTIEARAYDDAVAFRYMVPEQPGLNEFRLKKENTEFRISKDPFIYALVLPNYRSMYESEFIKLSASSLSNQGGVRSTVLVGLPLLMEVPGVAWMAITEADLRDYAAMYLVSPAKTWTEHWFESRLAPQVDNPDISVTGKLPHRSAWRVLLVGKEPGKLIESNAITSLNPESAIKDTSWIRPGKAAWDWWSGSIAQDGKSAYTTENMKYYVDFAAKSGLEYMLVDAGWSAQGDVTKLNGRVDIPEMARYAADKGVKVWIWLHYNDANRQMAEAFPLYAKWGVAGLKIDFMERDDQEGINFYYRAAEKAAEHRLMVDFHGATKPWGIERTYPNVLGYEAVLGMEQSKAGSRDNPEHHVTLPFTRMLAGQIDYTPGGFNNVTKEEFQPRMQYPMVMGTRAHHLAMYVVYESPFQMVSDHPAAYEGQPAFEFIKSVPAAWDETRVLGGRPGEYVIIARRRGAEWFLGAMTSFQTRQFDLSLDFLGDGRYKAKIYGDAPDADRSPKKLAVDLKEVTGASHLSALLAPAGGYAAHFVPLKP